MLYLPTTDNPITDVFTNTNLKKGQLYNIDNNEFLGFQFNPTSFEWSRSMKWAEINWIGNTDGGQLQFVGVGPRTLELSLIYISEPSAPRVSYESSDPVVRSDGLVDFEAIRDTIERWEEIIEGKGRPARIGIMVGPNVFEGVITATNFRITEFFEDLTAREAMFNLEFREWRPV